MPTLRSPRLVAGLVVVFLLLSFLMLSSGSFSRGTRANTFSEAITTYAGSDCTTPKTSWNLGEKACAIATAEFNDRRIAWVAPDGTIGQISDYFSASTTDDSYTFQTGTDPLAQVGTWRVVIINASGNVTAEATFVVRDPNNANANLSLSAFEPTQVAAGSNAAYRLELTNTGPDDAHNVTLTNVIPGSTTFVSEAQTSGPSFTCTNPSVGESSGTVSCTIASLPSNTTAIFTVTFKVDSGTANDNVISNTASVSSDTNDPQASNNTANSSTTVSGATSACTVNCPADIVTNQDPNQCGATVTYQTPTTSGDCGPSPAVTCNMPSGSFFPVGTTTVTCATGGGDSCSFTVTVNATTAPTITHCASPQTLQADANCEGAVMPDLTGQITATGCSAISQSPAAGTVLGTGNTLVTFTAGNSAGEATCTTIVSVVESTPPVITCPANITVNLPLNSTAISMVVTYPDATATDNCSIPTVSSTPASGSVFSVGTTTVTATATDSSSNTSSCSFTVTVHYNFTGFFSPVSNLPVVNVVNAGKAIPVKFSLSGNKGLNIFAAGYPAAGVITCNSNDPATDLDATVTAGQSSLSYDAGSDQYNYVWKTESSWAGTCRQLVIKLNDGSEYRANFRFK